MAEKIYVGSGKEKVFDGGGSVISVHLTLNDMGKYFEEYGYTASNGDKRIKLKIGSRREIGNYGESHTVELDTWKPDQVADPFGGQEGGGNNSTSFNVNDNSKPKNNDYRGADQQAGNPDDIPF